MASIERYEAGMVWVRDGVWGVAMVAAFLGWLPFAEALILGGVAWFGIALLRTIPRRMRGLRPFLARHWRTVNRILLFQVVATTGIGELVRTERMAEPVASALFVGSLVLSVGSLVLIGRRANRPA